VQYFKDDATAFNAEKQDVIDGKGVLNNRLSEFFMTGLNHRRADAFHQAHQHARAADPVGGDHSAGSGRAQRRGRLDVEAAGDRRGHALPRPIVEFYLKDDKLGDPLVTEEHIIAFGWAAQQDLDDMVALALRVNDFLSGVMMAVGIKLVDFKIEIGRIWDGDYSA
jgi:phosphoribosylaminoimidazole-succinocarboxamide synthase